MAMPPNLLTTGMFHHLLQTPLHPSMTPSHPGNATPAHPSFGTRTPMHPSLGGSSAADDVWDHNAGDAMYAATPGDYGASGYGAGAYTAPTPGTAEAPGAYAGKPQHVRVVHNARCGSLVVADMLIAARCRCVVWCICYVARWWFVIQHTCNHTCK